MIYIFTGPIRSGKTSFLMNLVDRIPMGGFLTPDVEGYRKIYFPADKIVVPFQVDRDHEDDTNPDVLNVGKFSFYLNSFSIAEKKTLEQCSIDSSKIIVIDEIGKLELKELGFHSLLDRLLRLNWSEKKLVLLVRDYLLDEVIEKYQLQEAIICTQNDLAEIL